MISIGDATGARDIAIPNDAEIVSPKFIHAVKGAGGAKDHLDAFRLERVNRGEGARGPTMVFVVIKRPVDIEENDFKGIVHERIIP